MHSGNAPWRNNLLRAFYACCEHAEIEGGEQNGSVDIHSIRGTFVSLSFEGGADPKAVQETVGHSTLQMTMNVYAKTTDRAKRKAIAALPFASVSDPDHIVSMEDALGEAE